MQRFLGFIFLKLLTVLLHCTEAACKGDTSIILKCDFNGSIPGTIPDIYWYFNSSRGNYFQIISVSPGLTLWRATYGSRLFQVNSSEPNSVKLNFSQLTDNDEGIYSCYSQRGRKSTYKKRFTLKFYRGAEPNPLDLTSVSDIGSNTCLCPNLRSLGDNELYLATKKNYPAIAVLDNTTAFKHTFTNESGGTYFWFLRGKYQEDVCTTVLDITNKGCYWPGISATGISATDRCKCVPCRVFVILLAVLFALLLIYAVVYVVILKKQTDTRRGWFIRDIVLIVLAVVELVFGAITIGLCFGMKGCYKDCEPNGTDSHLFRATIIFIILGIGAVINAVIITIITKKSQ